MNIESFMTPRLLAVAQMVKNSDCVADIGTDHAYVPVYLVMNNIVNSAIAMDINEGPIMRADENIKRFSLTDKIKTRLCDGLNKLKNNEADTVIIAGMGGVLINRIIDEDKDRLTSVKNYILQPMTAIDEVRMYLAKNGFKIIDERLAKEDEKIYTIISATRGNMDITDEIYYHVGECLIKNKDAILLEYLDGKIYEYEKAISSMKNTKNEETQKKSLHFEYLLSEFKRLKGECAKW
ncbi:MAG: SAM-dependent methyltransferase [Clostridia bacterium]|nr:SAM-dependent methyltransferase [Clostridia bacterium]